MNGKEIKEALNALGYDLVGNESWADVLVQVAQKLQATENKMADMERLLGRLDARQVPES